MALLDSPSPMQPEVVDPGPVLCLERVTKVFRRGAQTVRAVAELDLSVAAGEVVALTGPSGAGKSTVLHLAGGLARPEEGRVLLRGLSLTTASDREAATWRRRHVGFVFQFFHLLPTLTIVENAALPLLLDNRRDALQRARALLQSLGLSAQSSSLPSELAGGELQRAAVARALVAGPSVVLADEPTGSLDSEAGRVVIDALFEASRTLNTGVLVATHDPAVAARADRVVTMRDGRLVH